MNIALIGMMGTMKSSVGRELAAMLNRQFFDTDEEIVSREKLSVSEIFEGKGEGYFRNAESEIFAAVCKNNNAVIACGGGLPTIKENAALLSSSFTVLLTSTAETIFSRLKNDTTRPLLKDMSVSKIESIMHSRAVAYKNSAKITVATDGLTPVKVAQIIVGQITYLEEL